MTTWTIDEPRQQTLDQTVDSLRVWLAHGRLRVVAAEGPVRLDVRKVGRRGLDVKLEDGVLSIRHPVRDRRWVPFWWLVTGRRNYYADIIIAVPPTVAAALTLINGSALASGLRRGVTMDVTSGSITLMGVGGRVRAKTVSGGIQAVGVGGDLSMQTVSGEITLAESSAERVQARAVSGSVTCDLDNPFAQDVRIDTISGSITIRVPADADLDVNLNATSGGVTSAFPEVRRSSVPGTHAASGRLGRGTGRLNAYAVSGSVALLASTAADYDEDEDKDEASSRQEADHAGADRPAAGDREAAA